MKQCFLAQVPQGWSKGLKLLHCEGYCLYRPQLVKDMMQEAKAKGAQVSMDLASFEVGEYGPG
jgi:sugar/nucleoside kinase (ribokinase family)